MKAYTVAELCSAVKGELLGETDCEIIGPNLLEPANENEVTFIGHKKYIKQWATSKSRVAMVNESFDVEPGPNRAIIKVKDADVAMAIVLEMFVCERPVFDEDIHPKAVIHPSATIGESCKIGAGCYIGKNVVVEKGAILYPNVTVLDDSKIGANTSLWPGVVVRERCIVGSNCIIHPNASIGADGFGFRKSPDGRGLIKIPHIGNVVIGNGVEIGANSCVDRGKFGATTIGDGSKIDNLVQIGHNSKMGRCCIMAGSSGLAGSVTLGDGVIVGGGACISDHVSVGSGVMVGGMSGVISNVDPGKKVLGYPAVDAKDALRQWAILKKMVKKGDEKE